MRPTPASNKAGSLRCFFALLPDAASRRSLLACRDGAVSAKTVPLRGVRWLDAGSLHLTLRFLGQTSPAQIEYFTHMLPTLARVMPLVGPRRCAIWPNRARPRMLVLELEPLPALAALAQECEALALKAGFATEGRAFRPHMTLARLRPGCMPELPPVPETPIGFTSLALMASNAQPSGARYRTLAGIDLVPRRTGVALPPVR